MSTATESPAESQLPPTTSGKAIASLVLGILSFCIPLLLAIPGIILGILGLTEIRRSQGRLKGQGIAIAGIITSILGTTVFTLGLIFGLLPAVRETASREHSALHLSALIKAMHNYHDTLNSFPPAVVSGQDGKPLYSWRVLILPFLGEKKLYDQFKLDEPWDSPANKPLLAKMPKQYAPFGQKSPSEDFATHFMVFTGPDAPFDSGELPKWWGDPRYDLRSWQLYMERPGTKPVYSFGKRPRFASIMDGTTNTILLVEADDAVPWSKPQDLPYDAKQPIPKLGGLHRNGFCVAMADGAVRFVPNRMSEAAIRAAITPAGGEIMPPEWENP